MKIKQVKEWISNKNDEDTFVLLVNSKNIPEIKTEEYTLISKDFELDTQENLDELMKKFDDVVNKQYTKMLKDNPDINVASSTVNMESTQFKIMALAAMSEMGKNDNTSLE